MTRLTPATSVASVLLGLFLTADFVEAREMRSTADRRQRPGQGLWKSNSSSSSSYRSNSSWFRSTPRFFSQPQYRSTPRYYSQPQVRMAPQRIVHQQPVVRYHNSVPQSQVVTSPAPVNSIISTPCQPVVTTQPSVSGSPVHKVIPNPVPPVTQQPVTTQQR
ncbi:MAG: hypothetical protein RIK87_29650 [Fuerstiella sp.]